MTRFYLSAIITVLIASSHAIFAKVSAEGGGSYRPPAPKATPAAAPRPAAPVMRAEGGGSYTPPKATTPPVAPRPAAPVIRAEGGGGYVPAAPPKVTPPPATATATPQTPAPNPSRPVIRAEGGGGYLPVAPPKVTPPTTPAPTPSRPTARAEGGGGYVPPTPPVPKLTPAQEKTKFEIERYAKNNGYTPEQTAALVYRSMTPEKQRNADAAAAAAAREKLTGMTAAQEKTKFEIERWANNNGYTPEQTAALVYRSMTTTKQREADAQKAKVAADAKHDALIAKMERYDNKPVIPKSSIDPLLGKSQAEIQAWAKARGLSIQETKDLLNDYKGPTPSSNVPKTDPLAGKSQAEIQAWAKLHNLSIQETKDLMKDYKAPTQPNPLVGMTQSEIRAYAKDNDLTLAQLTTLMNDVKKNAPVVVTTVGLTDADGSGFAGSVCALTDPKCKNAGSIQAYGNNGNMTYVCSKTGYQGRCLEGSYQPIATVSKIPALTAANDFLNDKKAMDIYQRFIDGAKIDPKTGKVTLPEKICLSSGSHGCANWQYLNEKIVSTGLNPFTSKDNQTYGSVQDIMNQAVDLACGPNKITCNGNNQTANVAGHSAGGVTGTLTAIALNNANFNVTNMSGYEMVINNGQYNVLQDMGVNLTNYSATTTITGAAPGGSAPHTVQVKSGAGSGIAFGEGIIDSLIAGTSSQNRPAYYTGYVQRTDFNSNLDLAAGHATENIAVIATIKNSLETPQPTQPTPSYGGNTSLTAVNASAGAAPTATGTPRPPAPPMNNRFYHAPPPVRVVTSSQLPVGGQEYIPTATPTPPAP